MTYTRVVVTGGGGFLGKALCLRLCEMGREVISVGRGVYPELVHEGIRVVQADLADASIDWERILSDVSSVFHTAAKVEMWGAYDDFFAVNVLGTRRLIEACRRAGVRRLVFTSSPSVIADGTDLCGVDESYPYPARYDAFYPMTKAMAEKEVLAANARDGLHTIALRPHLIWGPGDRKLVPKILSHARAGKLVRIGSGNNLVDLTYIDDCVSAHLLAERALEDNPWARGKAYFISQGEPVPLWAWIAQVLKRNKLPPLKRSIPKWLALGAASVLEAVAGVEREPRFTRFLVKEMATSHYFDISAAKRYLGYEPKVSIERALDLTFGPLEPEPPMAA